MNPTQILSWIISGIGVIGFLAAAAQYIRGSADKGTIASLKSSVDALEIENDLKDRRILLLEHDNETKDHRIATLEQEVLVLHDAVGGKEELVKLQESADRHYAFTEKSIIELKAQISALAS